MTKNASDHFQHRFFESKVEIPIGKRSNLQHLRVFFHNSSCRCRLSSNMNISDNAQSSAAYIHINIFKRFVRQTDGTSQSIQPYDTDQMKYKNQKKNKNEKIKLV